DALLSTPDTNPGTQQYRFAPAGAVCRWRPRSSDQRRTMRQTRIVSSRRSVAVAYFLAFLGLGVFMPYFPLYLAHLGCAGWQIGSLVGRFSPAIVPVLLLLAAVPLAPALARLPREQAAPTREPRAPWMLLTPPLRAFLTTAFLLQVSSGAWTGFYALHTTSLGFPDT